MYKTAKNVRFLYLCFVLSLLIIVYFAYNVNEVEKIFTTNIVNILMCFLQKGDGVFMDILKVICLENGVQPRLPFALRYLPKQWQQAYLLRFQPYVLDENGVYCLQTQKEDFFTQVWREKTRRLFTQAAQQGAKIVLSPLWADLPQDLLPLANGKRLTLLYAAEGCAEALRRMGKEIAQAYVVLVDDGSEQIEILLEMLPQDWNHVAILTERAECFVQWQEQLLAQRGLVAEVFASVGHTAFRRADVVISCKGTGGEMLYALKEHAFLLDLGGNHELLHKIAEHRPDVCAVDGFVFMGSEDAMQTDAEAEAASYLQSKAFRFFFARGEEAQAARESLSFAVKGFLAEGKRKKIKK